MSSVRILWANLQAAHKYVACLLISALCIVCVPAASLPAAPLPAGSFVPAANPTKHVVARDVSVIDGSDSRSFIRPGDWLLISAGQRDALTLRNLRGEPGAPIVIVNYGGQVTIQTEGWVGLMIENSQYIHLTGTGEAETGYGFEIKGFTNVGLFARQGTEYIEIDHCWIHHSSASNAAGMRVHSTQDEVDPGWVQHDTSIHHCLIHDVSGEALYVGKGPGQDGTPLHGVEIAFNRAERIGWDAFQVRNAPQGCHVHHNLAQDIGAQAPGTLQGGAGLVIGEDTGGLWHDNVVINADRGIQLLGHRDGVAIYRNLLVHCGYFRNEGGIRWFTDNAAIVHHNTIVDSKAYGILVKGTATQGLIRDNFIVQSGEVHISAEVPAHHNVTVQRIRQAGFVAPWAGDYSLLWGSPARLAGSDGQDVGALPYRGEHVIPPSAEMSVWQ